ncbi:MAG: tetratricopeptide repeat protein [Planctomycetes bacterium]|nr:tetratricopeptide repeat protein [Planctomycetota bacterium]MBI3848023.1 tetratricopeptide repeat protein [Planctomycetota bacterium]
MKLPFAITVALALAHPSARSAEPGELFAKGVAAYGEKRYEDAAKSFEDVRGLGVESAELDYDLGSAYYRLGDVGRAIVAFRRAEKFAPRDPDLRENLAMALDRATERLPESGDLPWQKAFTAWRRSLSLGEEKALFVAAWTLAAAILLASLFVWRTPLRRVGLLVGVMAVVLGVSYLTRLHDEKTRPIAVVLDPKVEVRTGPGEDYSVHFLLHAGAELRVEETQGEWSKVSVSADRKGWLRASTIEKV